MNKNIIIWSASYSPVIGGVQTVASEMSKYFIKNNWNVEIITNRYPISLPKLDSVENIRVNRYIFLNNPVNYIKNRRFSLIIGWLFYKPYTILQLFLRFKRVRPKMVLLHFPDNQLIEIYLLSILYRFELITFMHGDEVYRLRGNTGLVKKYLLMKVLGVSKSISFCSDHLFKEFAKICKKEESLNKAFIMNNGVSNYFLNYKLNNTKDNFIFSVARFVPAKGLDILFDIANHRPNLDLQIAGGLNEDLSNLGIEPSYNQNLKMLGKLNMDEIAQYLSRTLITIIPSREEPYGIIVAEAICCGSPVIASNIGGIPEVIRNAQKNLNDEEKIIFNHFVKLVSPIKERVLEQIDIIISNYSQINEYLSIINKVRSNFEWGKRFESVSLI